MSDEEQYNWYKERGRSFVEHLMPTLRGQGSVWHRCTIEGLQGILTAGAILPSGPDTQRSRATDCTAHALDAVPLFDFDRLSQDEVFWAAGNDWAGFLHAASDLEEGPTIWLRIPRSAIDGGHLIFQGSPEWKSCEEAHPGIRRILYVEVWHRGSIGWRNVDAAYAAKIPFNSAEKISLEDLDTRDPLASAERLRRLWDEECRARRQAELAKPGVSQISASDAWNGILPDGPSDPQSEGARALAEAQARLERMQPKD